MALANYSDLIASLPNWTKRADLASLYPDFVTLAEARIGRDVRVQAQIVTATLTTTSGTRGVTLPTDFLEAQSVTVSSVSPVATLAAVVPEYLNRRYPDDYQAGQPVLYSISGTSLLLGPTPDAAYDIALTYYARFDGLEANSTNWLMTNHPGIYLSAVMAEASIYTMEDAGMWNAKYQGEVSALHQSDDESKRSGSAMRVRNL